MAKLLQGEALRKHARELGIDVDNTSSNAASFALSDSEIQDRVMAFEDHKRQDRLWIVALVSAIASALSAAAAFLAIYLHK